MNHEWALDRMVYGVEGSCEVKEDEYIEIRRRDVSVLW